MKKPKEPTPPEERIYIYSFKINLYEGDISHIKDALKAFTEHYYGGIRNNLTLDKEFSLLEFKVERGYYDDVDYLVWN